MTVAERNTSVARLPVDRPAIPGVLAEHLEELAYLSIQRRKLLFSGDIPLRRVHRHDQRMEAHFDGLRVGGAATVRLCEEVLQGEHPWLTCAAARTWIALGAPNADAVRAQVQNAAPELRAAWREVLRQLPPDYIRHLFPVEVFDTLPEGVLSIAVDAWGWHGLLPDHLGAALAGHPAVEIRFAVARHAGVPGLILRFLEDTDSLVRRAALWKLALQRPQDALNHARLAVRNEPADPFAVRILGLFGDRSDGSALVALLTRAEVRESALEALRDLAFPEFTGGLLELLSDDDEDIAAAASVAFESLVGRVSSGEQPLPEGVHPVRRHWERVRSKQDFTQRRLRGQRFPWQGAVEDEPMEFLWRRSLAGNVAEAPWLCREVPDGFFTGFPRSDAALGE